MAVSLQLEESQLHSNWSAKLLLKPQMHPAQAVFSPKSRRTLDHGFRPKSLGYARRPSYNQTVYREYKLITDVPPSTDPQFTLRGQFQLDVLLLCERNEVQFQASRTFDWLNTQKPRQRAVRIQQLSKRIHRLIVEQQAGRDHNLVAAIEVLSRLDQPRTLQLLEDIFVKVSPESEQLILLPLYGVLAKSNMSSDVCESNISRLLGLLTSQTNQVGKRADHFVVNCFQVLRHIAPRHVLSTFIELLPKVRDSALTCVLEEVSACLRELPPGDHALSKVHAVARQLWSVFQAGECKRLNVHGVLARLAEIRLYCGDQIGTLKGEINEQSYRAEVWHILAQRPISFLDQPEREALFMQTIKELRDGKHRIAFQKIVQIVLSDFALDLPRILQETDE